MKKAKVETQAELDAKLREYGSSLHSPKADLRGTGAGAIRAFAEGELRAGDYAPGHAGLLPCPQPGLRTGGAGPLVEKMLVRFDGFPSKQEACVAWAAWATRCCGVPLRAVVQRQSQGIDAKDGGYHDWTTRASLASEVLDQAIFTLPVGRLSERLEDSEGFHIVRVVERTEAGRVPFEQTQVDIKEKCSAKSTSNSRSPPTWPS